MRRLFLVALLFAISTGSGAADEAIIAEGRARSDAFLGRNLASIWDGMTPRMQSAIGSRAAFSAFRDRLERDFGAEIEVLSEDASREEGLSIYLRTSRWTGSSAPMLMQWVFDGAGKVTGFHVRQKPVQAESRFLDYQTKAALRLPFEGEWFVHWGGRTLEQNYHGVDRGQRFATDFVVRRNGSTHHGEAAELRNYFCWNQPILAPGAGTIVAAKDGLPDQPIGSRDPANPAGNHVVIDFGHGEFGFLAHLKQGSVANEPGEKVEPGQEVGRCGNSGNTSEPHLHFHLQTTAVLGRGEGLPAFFSNYRADEVRVERGEPVQGQVVSPLASE